MRPNCCSLQSKTVEKQVRAWLWCCAVASRRSTPCRCAPKHGRRCGRAAHRCCAGLPGRQASGTPRRSLRRSVKYVEHGLSGWEGAAAGQCGDGRQEGIWAALPAADGAGRGRPVGPGWSGAVTGSAVSSQQKSFTFKFPAQHGPVSEATAVRWSAARGVPTCGRGWPRLAPTCCGLRTYCAGRRPRPTLLL